MIPRPSQDEDFRLAFSVRCDLLHERSANRAKSTPAARTAKQFSRQHRASLTNHEYSVKVFNSSVENRVEKARPKIEIARHYRGYSSLHKFRAEEAVLKAWRDGPFISRDTFLGMGKSSGKFPERTKAAGRSSIPMRWRFKVNRDRFFALLDVEPFAVGVPALGDHLNQDFTLRNLRDLHRAV